MPALDLADFGKWTARLLAALAAKGVLVVEFGPPIFLVDDS